MTEVIYCLASKINFLSGFNIVATNLFVKVSVTVTLVIKTYKINQKIIIQATIVIMYW